VQAIEPRRNDYNILLYLHVALSVIYTYKLIRIYINQTRRDKRATEAIKVAGIALAATELKGFFEPLFYSRRMKHETLLGLNDVFL